MYRWKTFLILWLFILGAIPSGFAQRHINFSHLSPSTENKSIAVNQTIQDHLGNMWMVQSGDVYVFDGYSYTFISNQTLFPTAPQYVAIKDILRDGMDTMWLLSKSGLLTHYLPASSTYKDVSVQLKTQKVSAITAKGASLWFITDAGDVYRHHNDEIEHVLQFQELHNTSEKITDLEVSDDETVFVSTSHGNIYSYSLGNNQSAPLVAPFNNYPETLIMTIDSYNRLWIGTETKGLYLYDITTRRFIQDSFFKSNFHNIKNELFLSLYCDISGFLWAGTDGGGLYKVNLLTGDVSLYTKKPYSDNSLSSNTILDINEDNHKNIWITPNYGNLNILPNSDNNINYHEGSSNGIPRRILSIYRTAENTIWVGTDGSGLTKITPHKDGTTSERQYLYDPEKNNGFYIQSLTEDNKGNLWIGTYKNGLWIYNSKTDKFTKRPVVNNKNQEAIDIRTVYNDSKGRIWVGSNTCLNLYGDDLKPMASFETNSHGLKGTIVESILEDKNGTVWLGAVDGGFFQFDENHRQLETSTFIDRSIINNALDRIKGVKHMTEGAFKSLWLINEAGRLLKYDTQKGTFATFNQRVFSKRLLTAVINAGNDNLWISSNNGIINFNAQDGLTKTFFITDGLQDNTFLARSAFKDDRGMIYFGGLKGLNYFYPQYLKKEESVATLQINDIEVLNQPAQTLLPDQIDKGIANVETLNLTHDQSSFSFRFAALDNILYPKHFYAYRLKGFDDHWVTNQTNRSATYTNIPAGSYTFEVKAGTREDVWNTPTKRIAIFIAHPWWNTPVAWLLYTGVFFLIIYAVRRWYSLKKKLLVQKINSQNENEMHHIKMNFFAKMSHEIQTPLTLILGPIDDMIQNAEKTGNLLLKQRLSIISYNTKRLSRIAQELTLVRNKELNKVRLNVSKVNLNRNLDDIVLSFKELARKKHIDFTVNCPQNLENTWYDKEKIEHILYNLLSNAFKFTPPEGNIQLEVLPINDNRSIKISVTDSGGGIPKDELDSIFELFYQAKTGKKHFGTGIGLALTKELIDLHKGVIEVNSEPEQGTTFTITFPIDANAYTDAERVSADHDDLTEAPPQYQKIVNENTDQQVLNKTILLVEDTSDLQLYLKEILESQYHVLLAENGETGYKMAKQHLPDLILSDIMMPKLDGIQMCKKLQQEVLTKHIPVILLTAKNSSHSKISGLQSGAIEYLNKPFNTNELLLKIQNILLSKEHILSKYRQEIISQPEVELEKSPEDVFLENLVANINTRIEDSNFKMEELTGPMHMSYSSLYRKCQALTGYSLVDFVRILRLKRAALLMAKQGYTVSEIAFMTGFNDPKYFSKCFKKQFRKNPGEFKKGLQKFGVDAYLEKHKINSML